MAAQKPNVTVEEVNDHDYSFATDSEYETGASTHDHSDDDSDEDSDDDQDILNETVLERIAALQLIFPHGYSRKLKSSISTLSSSSFTVAKWVGNIAWGVTTSIVLFGFPILFNLERDQTIEQMEKEQRKQQQGAQQMLNPGAALHSPVPSGLVPPGFQ